MIRNKLQLFVAIYFLVLVSIPIASYILRIKVFKNSLSNIQASNVQQQLPVVVFKPDVISTPVPTPTPTEPSPTPVPTRVVSKASSKPKASIPGPKVAGVPARIQISKIGMNATVEQVGLETDGTMSVPKSWWTVGWYSLGYKVGDNGSAVMSGHFDTNTGAPAVFYKVGRLSPGDTITVTNNNGSVFKFRVYKKESYPWNQMPMQIIFNTSGRVQLNLITCSGTWDKATQNYSHRTVVYSELAN